MELAKRFIDVGIFTNRLDEMRAFYGERIRLPYEELLPVGGGVRQYRYGLLGSVLKINHSRDQLPPRIAGGYHKISISDPRTPMPIPTQDPDGNDIELIPGGQRGVNQIEIHIGVTDEADFEKFYAGALQAERLGAGRFKLGETIISCRKDPAAVRAEKSFTVSQRGGRCRVDARGRDALHHGAGARRRHGASTLHVDGRVGRRGAGIARRSRADFIHPRSRRQLY